MEYIVEALNTTLHSFDFSFCICVNVLTYIIISIAEDINGAKRLKTWYKRIILLISILFFSIMYYSIGIESKLILNSAILAPVFWSWILKPICNKCNIDYKKDIDNIDTLNNN